MTIDSMFVFIRSWMDQILNTELSLNIPIIFGSENAPRPALPYIVIHDPPISNVDVGRGNWCKWNFTNQPVDEGQIDYTKQYEATISVEHIGGSGQVFNYLRDSIGRYDIKELWRTNYISYMRDEPANDISEIAESFVERRVGITMFVSYISSNNYDPGYIGSVDTPTGTYNK